MQLSKSWKLVKVVWDWNHCGYDLFHWSLELFGFLVGHTAFLFGWCQFQRGGAALRFWGYIASSLFSKALGVASMIAVSSLTGVGMVDGW